MSKLLSVEKKILLPTGVSQRKLEIANIAGTTTKVAAADQRQRKSLINLHSFFRDILKWQKERLPLAISNQDLQLLILLFLGEVEEIAEHRELEGLPTYDFKSERGETIDVGFFLAALTVLLNSTNTYIDFGQVLTTANGQSNSSRALDNLREVGGNLTEKTLQQDLQYLWTLWVSYLIHMKYPVNPNQVLKEYTFPKNNGNYPQELLEIEGLYQRLFGKKMDDEAHKQYFVHFRKSMRVIRDFLIQYIDPTIEHTGMRPEQYRPYRMLIFSFTKLPGFGVAPEQALVMLTEQLYKDYGIEKPKTEILVVKNLAFVN